MLPKNHHKLQTATADTLKMSSPFPPLLAPTSAISVLVPPVSLQSSQQVTLDSSGPLGWPHFSETFPPFVPSRNSPKKIPFTPKCILMYSLVSGEHLPDQESWMGSSYTAERVTEPPKADYHQSKGHARPCCWDSWFGKSSLASFHKDSKPPKQVG